MRAAQRALRQTMRQAPVSQVERETIRAVFLRNGFTVKEGQTDLKPYVYAAAEELLSIASADWQRTQSAPVSEVERRPIPSGWAVKREAPVPQELPSFLGPMNGWYWDARRAVLFGNEEAAIAAQAVLSVGSKLAISVVWLAYDDSLGNYLEQVQ